MIYAKPTADEMAQNHSAAWSEHDRLEAERKARLSALKTRAAELVATGIDQRAANRQARMEIS